MDSEEYEKVKAGVDCNPFYNVKGRPVIVHGHITVNGWIFNTIFLNFPHFLGENDAA